MESKVDLIVVDTAHGHTKKVLTIIKRIKKISNNCVVCAGNIATGRAANFLADAGADIILLDNMTPSELREAVSVVDSRSQTEASGGIKLDNVREVADTGVNYISGGAITHSAPAVDISMNISTK